MASKSRHIKLEFKSILSGITSCRYCSSTERLEIDHIEPICFGGISSIENLTVCCSSCNSIKSGKSIANFLCYINKEIIRLYVYSKYILKKIRSTSGQDDVTIDFINFLKDKLKEVRFLFSRYIRIKISLTTGIYKVING